MTKEQRDWITREAESFRAQAAQLRSQALMYDGALQAFEQLLARFPDEPPPPAPSPDDGQGG